MTDTPEISFDDFLLLVGKLNYSWTNTESLLIHLIAGLSGVDKETAVVIFLTLNTSRARMDLVQRLAKLERIDVAERSRILKTTERIMKLSALRNRYNHCIYTFDPESGHHKTILMRIADRKNNIKMGQTDEIDDNSVKGIKVAITELKSINEAIWKIIKDFSYPI
ncbi:hypothetical protein F9L33_14770 [Amylibacter sp. SFDW26]|uniref:hypothetical protein n=1 Tax=Amylibacter sp. SFDW26 TaxID=2652722 RepID=UPI001261E201|nr:hypothetical protein [Amylibacter sp. SFDW26]KAB7610155.1 hypothetical protein F9L33_14770 [Amylibacter sp. SFDW26]